MKMKVLKGFSSRALGKRTADEVFEVPEGVKVGALQAQGFIAPSRSEPTVEVASTDTATVSTAAARTAPAKKAARKAAR